MEKIMEILSDPQMIALIIGAAVFVFIIGIIFLVFHKKKHYEWDNME